MKKFASVLLVASAQVCFSQVVLEHSAAAAGGTAGALAGRPVSESIGKVFGNVDKAGRKAATKPEKVKPESPNSKEAIAGEANRTMLGPATPGAGMPASFGGVTRQNHAPKVAYPKTSEPDVPETAPVAITPAPAPLPVVHYATREEIASLPTGTPRTDVLAKLGKPASAVTIPDDDGHLREIFKYVSGTGWIGTVRLDNGSVVQVDSAR